MQTSPSNKYIVDHDDDVDADGREPIGTARDRLATVVSCAVGSPLAYRRLYTDDDDVCVRTVTDLDREHASRARFDGVNQSVRADCGFYDDFDDDFHYGVAAPLKTRTTTTTTKDAK